jgi:hypothetical protein
MGKMKTIYRQNHARPPAAFVPALGQISSRHSRIRVQDWLGQLGAGMQRFVGRTCAQRSN